MMIEEDEIWLSEAQARDLQKKLEEILMDETQMNAGGMMNVVEENGDIFSVDTKEDSDS
ncbi:hypothetical protein EGH25_10610 [Haladaptatus sp. F3-133]|uniref:Uncharacterized protein n=1 Tax=Halorutilus salinus TaxID=2487751 RepID=A0A9Q4GIE9_9EURY|nr:hypothetical protein [Halorutilus salinus]MCX2819800.1 hypothetical protein [Halorutilus salinus]